MKRIYLLHLLLFPFAFHAQDLDHFSDSQNWFEYSIITCRCDSNLLLADSLYLERTDILWKSPVYGRRDTACNDTNSVEWPHIGFSRYGFNMSYQTIDFIDTADSIYVPAIISSGFSGFYEKRSGSVIALRGSESSETFCFYLVAKGNDYYWIRIPGPYPPLFTWEEWQGPFALPFEQAFH